MNGAGDDSPALRMLLIVHNLSERLFRQMPIILFGLKFDKMKKALV